MTIKFLVKATVHIAVGAFWPDTFTLISPKITVIVPFGTLKFKFIFFSSFKSTYLEPKLTLVAVLIVALTLQSSKHDKRRLVRILHVNPER